MGKVVCRNLISVREMTLIFSNIGAVHCMRIQVTRKIAFID